MKGTKKEIGTYLELKERAKNNVEYQKNMFQVLIKLWDDRETIINQMREMRNKESLNDSEIERYIELDRARRGISFTIKMINSNLDRFHEKFKAEMAEIKRLHSKLFD